MPSTAPTPKRPIGIPYARQEWTNTGIVAVCPVCRKRLKLSTHKDAESFSLRPYQEHYARVHTDDSARLERQLDADRGRDNGGCGDQLPALRAILTRTHAPTFPGDPPSLWEWLLQLDDVALDAFRGGQWFANDLEKHAAACWEQDRRLAHVTPDEARAMLARKGT